MRWRWYAVGDGAWALVAPMENVGNWHVYLRAGRYVIFLDSDSESESEL